MRLGPRYADGEWHLEGGNVEAGEHSASIIWSHVGCQVAVQLEETIRSLHLQSNVQLTYCFVPFSDEYEPRNKPSGWTQIFPENPILISNSVSALTDSCK